jgi:hypothetical protein
MDGCGHNCCCGWMAEIVAVVVTDVVAVFAVVVVTLTTAFSATVLPKCLLFDNAQPCGHRSCLRVCLFIYLINKSIFAASSTGSLPTGIL